MFEKFTDELQHAFRHPLPGKAAHELLKPYLKINKNLEPPQLLKPKNAAVMTLIYPVDNIPTLLFIERPVYDGAHSGQIAFPGGKIEKSDTSFLDAALRETQEEIGIERQHINNWFSSKKFTDEEKRIVYMKFKELNILDENNGK